MGLERGRLALSLDLLTDALALVGQHGVYCQSARQPGKPAMDIQLILKCINDAKELTIGVGLRLTGWVAANRSTIVNSEAALDLGNITTKLQPTPQLCLSAHMAVGTEMVGALTAYSTLDRPFTANEVSLFEMLACLLAPIVRNDATARAVRHEHEPSRLPPIERATPTRRALRAV